MRQLWIHIKDILFYQQLHWHMMKQDKKHVIVIGGGLSGLSAAHLILKKQPQTQVTVLQANDYLGGRTKSISINGCNFDLGGAFIGPTQHHAIQLAIQSKNQLVNVNSKGRKIIEFKNEIGSYTSNIPDKVNILALIQMQWVIWKIDRMAKKVPSLDPKACELGYYWDSVTVKSWIDDNISFTKVKVMLQAAIRVILGVQLCQVSMLYMLYYIKQSESFQNLINVQNGLQQKKTSQGTQHMSIYLGQQIKAKRGNIKLQFYVKQIIQNERGCVVIGQDGTKFQSDYIIIAMPPCSAGKINFQPCLSNQRKYICERSFMGILIKVIVLYKKQYWVQKGFSGQTLSDCYDSPVMNGFDDSRVNQNGQLQPALAIFIGGGVIRYWMNRQDFKDVLLRKLAQYYKEPEMLNPLHVTWCDWHNQKYIRGGPVSPFYPGALSHIDNLRKAEGRIHWAGTQMATISTGFMDGAIESGKRAANEILNILQGSKQINSSFINERQKQKNSMDYPYTRTTYKKSKYFEWW